MSGIRFAAVQSQSDQEEPGLVGCGNDCLAVDQECRPGLDGDAAQAGRRRFSHGRDADRRQIDAPVLPGFPDLDQNAPRSAALEFAAAFEQSVGAFDCLHAQHKRLLNDNRLANIEIPYGPGDLQPARDIALSLPVRQRPTHRAGRRKQTGYDVLYADNPETEAFQFRSNRPQKPVIAKRLHRNPRKEGRRFRVWTDFVQGRPSNPADHDDVPDALFPCPFLKMRCSADPDDLVPRREDGGMIGVPLQRKHEVGPPRLFAGFDGQRRYFSAAGDDGERSGLLLSHWLPAAGRSAVPDLHG